jgi:hypothetical protein
MRYPRRFQTARAVAVVATLTISAAMPPTPAMAHGAPAAEEPLSRFEQFVSGCSPCLKESVTIATISVPALNVAALSQTLSGRTARPGQILIEALRSQVIGTSTSQLFGVRLTLSITTGPQGELFRLSSGVLDEEDVRALERSLGKMVDTASSPALSTSTADSIEIDAHTTSVRVGVIRLKGDSVAYVQAGDIHALARRPVWEAPGTLYLPVAELPRLRSAFKEAAARIQKMRASP